MRTTILSLLVTSSLAASAYAQSTAFTYQGQLKAGSNAASGLHDIRFRLFDAATGGAQVGTTQCVDNVTVTNGLFTTTLDFGQQFATPAPRFLEIEVRVDSGLNCANTTGYTVLAPRQALTATPMASSAKSAFSLAAVDGSPANAVFVDNNGNVGIGTTAPTARLEVNGASTALINTGDQAELLWFGTERSWVFKQEGTGVGTALKLQSIGGGGNKNFIFQTTGNVGIGTTTPSATLHVANDLPFLVLQDTGTNSTQSGYLGFWNSTPTETAWVGYGTPGSTQFSIYNSRGNISLIPGAGGVVQVPVLQITGADLAEKFPASETLEPGMVVAIDRDNAGKLCLARGSYNRCVAGVVSGANNFSAGAVLGNLPGHEDAPAVALSGRVYVHCDATAGPIEPGDLLTTSDTPGHAMKATDRDRSHGAVIGKAMTSLKEGRGMVLVLINLQ